jgi:protein arginine kinase
LSAATFFEKMKDLHEFLVSPAETARRHGPHDRIVMSSRVRLARNLKDAAFPGWAKKPERVKILEMIRPAVESLPEMKDAFSEAMDNLGALDKQILVERHLISREHAAKSSGSGLVLNREETFCVMINEEDHLRMQALRPGLQLRQAWNAIDHLDSELEKKLDYAFDNDLGYLTACPTNLGTGIRVSAMLHLPGLGLGEQINPIIQSVNKLGLAVRGLYGEGTEALGNVFQVSNQMTLGENEPAIVERLEKVLSQIIEHEENARQTLLEKKPKVVFNHIGRAYGILANAHSISSKETMNLLSLMRLGVDMGLFPGAERSLVDELFLVTQPAHLQKKLSDKLSAEERDLIRADMVRERLKNVSRPVVKPPCGPTGRMLRECLKTRQAPIVPKKIELPCGHWTCVLWIPVVIWHHPLAL